MDVSHILSVCFKPLQLQNKKSARFLHSLSGIKFHWNYSKGCGEEEKSWFMNLEHTSKMSLSSLDILTSARPQGAGLFDHDWVQSSGKSTYPPSAFHHSAGNSKKTKDAFSTWQSKKTAV